MKLADRVKSAEMESDFLAIRPPAFIRPFLEEDRDPAPEDAGLFRMHFERWQKAISRAIEREHVSLQDLLDALPVRFRERVIGALREQIEAGEVRNS